MRLFTAILVFASCSYAQVSASGRTGGTGTQLGVINAQTSTYQVIATDFQFCKTIPVSSGTFTITLLATAPNSGQCLYVINYGTGVVTVAPNGLTINGSASSQTIAAGSVSAPHGLYIVSDGTNYFAQPYGGASGVTLSTTGSGYFLPFGDVAFQTAGGAFTANDNVVWQFVCCQGNSFAANTISAVVFTGQASSHVAAAIYNDGGLASGTYTSGITAVGTSGQTCTLTAFNGGIASSATATVALSGTNTISGGASLVITNAGFGATSAPTTATVAAGTASSCTGTPVLATVLGAGSLVVQATTGTASTTQARVDSALASTTTLTNGTVYWVSWSGDTTSLALAEEGTTTASLFGVLLNQPSHPREGKCANTVSWSSGVPTFPAICGALSNLGSHRAPQMAVLP